MGDIAYQNKDITAKILAEGLKGKSLAVFGLPNLRIADSLPTNLPAIESNELRLDHLFSLEDGSVAIIDYESDLLKRKFCEVYQLHSQDSEAVRAVKAVKHAVRTSGGGDIYRGRGEGGGRV